jgi:hypothetical protein
MWEMLLKEVETQEESGVSVQFWLVRREWNVEADRQARMGAVSDLVAFGSFRMLMSFNSTGKS